MTLHYTDFYYFIKPFSAAFGYDARWMNQLENACSAKQTPVLG